MTWLLAYLLVGFVMFFAAVQAGKVSRSNTPWWELAAVLFWPVAVAVGFFAGVKARKGHGR